MFLKIVYGFLIMLCLSRIPGISLLFSLDRFSKSFQTTNSSTKHGFYSDGLYSPEFIACLLFLPYLVDSFSNFFFLSSLVLVSQVSQISCDCP